jgi:hypothetical protein
MSARDWFFGHELTTHLKCSTDIKSARGRVIAQAVSRRSVIMEARVRARVSSYGICGGLSGTGTGFSQSSLVFDCQYNSAVYLHIHISPGG